MNALEVEGVDFSYGPMQVLFDVGITVAAPTDRVVLGPPGEHALHFTNTQASSAAALRFLLGLIW